MVVSFIECYQYTMHESIALLILYSYFHHKFKTLK